MSEQVPEYYQHLDTPSTQDAKGQQRRSAEEVDEEEETGASSQIYRADSFLLTLPCSAWTDGTVYSFVGPVVDGLRHTITVTQIEELDVGTPAAFAEQEMNDLESTLDGWGLLMEGPLPMVGETSAHRVIFRWTPEANRTLYQEQIYTLHDGGGSILSAGFTDQSRRQIGDRVERMMRSFRPKSGAV